MYSDDHGVVVCGVFLGLAECVLSVVSVDNGALKLCSELRVDGVNYISVGAVRILSGGHNYKEALSCVDDLNVVNGKAIIERN